MMFKAFQQAFSKDKALSVENAGIVPRSEVAGWNELIDQFGGVVFERGLYRVIRASDVGAWNARIAGVFPEFDGRVTCFGYDWLGRVFAVDPKRPERGRPGVVMFEPGTGEALEIPCNIATFHNGELIEYRDAAVASDLYKRWLANGGVTPRYEQCIGYKKPLFLGGSDELDNLDVCDVDVYWHLMAQLILKARALPPGTQIRINLS